MRIVLATVAIYAPAICLALTHQRRQRLSAVDARLDVEHADRLAADIELVRDAGRDDRGAAAVPVAAVDAQAERAIEAGKEDRSAVLVRGVVQ